MGKRILQVLQLLQRLSRHRSDRPTPLTNGNSQCRRVICAKSPAALLCVITRVDNGPARQKARGAKYAWNQTVLDAAIQDLEAWEGRCKVALDLNMRDPNPLIDERLKKLRQTQHPVDAAVGAQGATATTMAA